MKRALSAGIHCLLGLCALVLALPASAHAAAAPINRPVVVILTGGLRWDQLDDTNAPTLAALVESGSSANLIPLTTHGVPCPIDTWLALSAGRQASQSAVANSPTCNGVSITSGTQLNNWQSYIDALGTEVKGAKLGALAERLAAVGVTTSAIGSGGAYVLADTQGNVPPHFTAAPENRTSLGRAVAESAGTHKLTVVDADAESYASDEERQAARDFYRQALAEIENPTPGVRDLAGVIAPDTIDGSLPNPQRSRFSAINTLRVESILKRIPVGTRVVLASTVDIDTSTYMQMFLMADINEDGSISAVAADGSVDTSLTGGSLASSPSVRRPGVVQSVDLTTTLLTWFGASTEGVSGTVLTTNSPCTSDSCHTARTDSLADQATHSGKIRNFRGSFVSSLTTFTTLFFLLSLVILWSHALITARPFPRRRSLTLLSTRVAWAWLGLTIAAVPLAALVVNTTTQWWLRQHAWAVLVVGSWILAGVMACFSLLVARWRKYAPLLLIGGASAVFIAYDAATGSRVMSDSPVGFNLLTAARFYGLGNEAYSVMAAGALVTLSFLGVWLRARIGGVRAALIVGAFGAIFAFIDGAPWMGADFGGVLSLVPAVIVLCLMLAGVHRSYWAIMGVGFATVVAAAIAAVGDWMRPPAARTHLGRFVQSIIDGELFDVLARKLGTNLRLLKASSYRWVVLTGLIVLFVLAVGFFSRQATSSIESHQRVLRTSSTPETAATSDAMHGDSSALFPHAPESTPTCSEVLASSRSDVSDPPSIRSLSRNMRSCAWKLLTFTRRFWHIAPLNGQLREATQLSFTSLSLCFILAFLLNDSGIVLPALAMILTIPGFLVIALLETD